MIRRLAWRVWERRHNTIHATLASNGYQETLVRITALYTPNVIVVRRGTPGSCTTKVMLVEFGKHTTLPTGETVPDWTGEYRFWCGQGMARGKIIVVEQSGPAASCIHRVWRPVEQ